MRISTVITVEILTKITEISENVTLRKNWSGGIFRGVFRDILELFL